METIFLSLNYIEFEEANVSAFEATFLPLSERKEGIFTIPDTVNLISRIVEKVSNNNALYLFYYTIPF
jgi:hypothetical protein